MSAFANFQEKEYVEKEDFFQNFSFCTFFIFGNKVLQKWKASNVSNTVKLGDKERFDKEQIGVKELFADYQPFYTINILLDK